MNGSKNSNGTLYVVATPIGNLGDISRRAVDVLAGVSCVAAEDTRHTRKLLAHLGIDTPLLSLHEHNEKLAADRVLRLLARGEDVALVSDAGTPLISDPGYPLVRRARSEGCPVVPVPGASALVAALSVSGMPTDRFVFEGFLPKRQTARLERLRALADETRTLVFYESSHRITESLGDMATAFGSGRNVFIAREMTKTFETYLQGTLQAVQEAVAADANQQKGEFVVIVHGADSGDDALDAGAVRVFEMLLDELPLKKAAALAAKITGAGKNALYDYGLSLKKDG